jgi:hypothetical protein
MSKDTPSKLSWTPVRKGDKYCAPACGAGCTFEAYRTAQIKAKELAERLGPDWVPHVWENMNWYYCAKSHNGFMKVHPLINGGYHAFLGKDTAGGRWVSDGHEDPMDAVKEAIKMAKDEALETLTFILEVIPC